MPGTSQSCSRFVFLRLRTTSTSVEVKVGGTTIFFVALFFGFFLSRPEACPLGIVDLSEGIPEPDWPSSRV